MEKNTQPQRDAAARIQNPTVRAIVLPPPSGTDPVLLGRPRAAAMGESRWTKRKGPCRTQTICSTGRKPRAVQCAPPVVCLVLGKKKIAFISICSY